MNVAKFDRKLGSSLYFVYFPCIYYYHSLTFFMEKFFRSQHFALTEEEVMDYFRFYPSCVERSSLIGWFVASRYKRRVGCWLAHSKGAQFSYDLLKVTTINYLTECATIIMEKRYISQCFSSPILQISAKVSQKLAVENKIWVKKRIDLCISSPAVISVALKSKIIYPIFPKKKFLRRTLKKT